MGSAMYKRFCLFLLFFLAVFVNGRTQTIVEGQVGGADYIGLSANAGYEWSLSKKNIHFLMPSVGLGVMFPPMLDATPLLRGGLQYRFRGWGIGSEVTRLFSTSRNNFVEMLLYPNISHTGEGKGNFYFRMSLGALLAYSRIYSFGPLGSNRDDSRLKLEKGLIPGGSLAIGFRLGRPLVK